MAVSWLINIGGIWRQCKGDFRTRDGKKLIVNQFNNAKSIDFLHYMRFECFQYIQQFNIFLSGFSIFVGISYGSISSRLNDAALVDDMNFSDFGGWLQLPVNCKITNLCNIVSKILFVIWFTVILRNRKVLTKKDDKSETDEEDLDQKFLSQEFEIMTQDIQNEIRKKQAFSTWSRIMVSIIILMYTVELITMIVVAIGKKSNDITTWSTNELVSWIDIYCFFWYMVYLIMIKLVFDLNLLQKIENRYTKKSDDLKDLSFFGKLRKLYNKEKKQELEEKEKIRKNASYRKMTVKST